MTRTPLRRLAFVLATLQIVATAAAPIVEAATSRPPGPVALESHHSASCVRIHQESLCLACQMLTAQARRPESARIPRTVDRRDARRPLAEAPLATRPPAAPRHSRAPPPTT